MSHAWDQRSNKKMLSRLGWVKLNIKLGLLGLLHMWVISASQSFPSLSSFFVLEVKSMWFWLIKTKDDWVHQLSNRSYFVLVSISDSYCMIWFPCTTQLYICTVLFNNQDQTHYFISMALIVLNKVNDLEITKREKS